MSSRGKMFISGGDVPRKEAWKFSFGILGQNLSCAFMTSWFMVFCTDVLYINSAVIGIILGIARIWDAVNDPLMGTLIDRHRFKNGEKLRPFLRATPIAVAILVVLLFTDWGFQGEMPKAIYILIFYLIYDMCFTVQDISMWGMTSIMTSVPAERDKLAQFGRIFAGIGFTVCGLFPMVLDMAGKLGTTQKTMYFIGALVLGAGGMFLSILSHSAKERVHAADTTEKLSLKENLGMLLKNKIVILVLIGSILNGLSLTVPAAYFFQYKVSATLFGNEVGGLTMLALFNASVTVFSAISMFFTNAIARRVGGMKNILVFGNVVIILMRVLAFFVGYHDGNIWVTLVLFGLASFPSGMFGIARTALWGDSIDYMEWKTGKRAEAITFAAQTFCDKITTALNTVIAGVVLALLSYDAKAIEAGAPLSEAFNTWIWPLYILGPIIGAALYLIPLLFIKYPNSLKEQVTRELRERRALEKSEE